MYFFVITRELLFQFHNSRQIFVCQYQIKFSSCVHYCTYLGENKILQFWQKFSGPLLSVVSMILRNKRMKADKTERVVKCACRLQ